MKDDLCINCGTKLLDDGCFICMIEELTEGFVDGDELTLQVVNDTATNKEDFQKRQQLLSAHERKRLLEELNMISQEQIELEHRLAKMANGQLHKLVRRPTKRDGWFMVKRSDNLNHPMFN